MDSAHRAAARTLAKISPAEMRALLRAHGDIGFRARMHAHAAERGLESAAVDALLELVDSMARPPAYLASLRGGTTAARTRGR